MADIVFVRTSPDRFWRGSGEFNSTIKTSQTSSLPDPWGCSTDDTDFYWIATSGFQRHLRLQSGIFTPGQKATFNVASIESSGSGIAWDGTNVIWCGSADDKLYLQSGALLVSLKDSQSIVGTDTNIKGVSTDGIDTFWCGQGNDKLYLQSGIFSATVKTSQSVSGVDTNPTGISWNGTDTIWCGREAGKFYKTSGKFSATILTSDGYAGTSISGIGATDTDARLTTPTAEISVSPIGLTFGVSEVDATYDLETTITSYGILDLTVSGLTVDNNFYTIISPTSVPFVVEAAGTTTATIRYSPTVAQTDIGSFDITSDAVIDPILYVPLYGIGIEIPDITINPTTLDYGSVDVESTFDLTTTISNTGTGSLVVSGLTVDNNFYTIISPTSVPFSLTSAGSTVATVRFSPTVATTESGTFSVTSNDEINTVVGVTLYGYGITPEIDLDIDSLNFGNIDVGNTYNLTTVISNLGNKDLTVSGMTVDNNVYTIINPISVPFVVSPAGSTEATLQFTPVAAGTITSSFTITNDDLDESEYVVSLSGNGILFPEIDISPTSLDYGSLIVPATLGLTTVISNFGNYELTVSGMTVDDSVYTIVSPTSVPFTIPASGSTIATINFIPVTGGTVTSTFTVTSDDADEPIDTVALSGFGQLIPEIDVSPTTLNYGFTDITTTLGLTTTISNSNLGILTVSGMTVDNNLYTIVSPTSVPFYVAAAGSTVVTINFSPVETGVHYGNFTITNNDSDESTVVVGLTGIGSTPIEEAPIYFNLYIDQARDFTSYIDQARDFDLEM